MLLYVFRVVQFGVLDEVKQNALCAHQIRLSVTQYLRLYRLLDFHEIRYGNFMKIGLLSWSFVRIGMVTVILHLMA